MRTVLTLVLTAWLAPAAGAQNNPAPGQLPRPAETLSGQPSPQQPAAASTAPALTLFDPTPGPDGFRPSRPPAPVSTGTAPGQPAPEEPVEASTRPVLTRIAPPPEADGFRPFVLPDAPPVPKGPGVEPAQPETDPIMRLTLEQLRQKHRDAVADLKKEQAEEIKAIREKRKGMTRTEIRKAVDAKKAEHRAAVRKLEDANKAEIERYKRNLPRPMEN